MKSWTMFVRALLALLLLLSPTISAGADAPGAPRFLLSVTSSPAGTAEYAAMAVDVAVGDLSFGRPRSALDGPGFTGPGLSLALPRSHASAAAAENRLGPGLLFESHRVLGVTVSGSWHAGQDADEDLVAVTGQFEPDTFESVGRLAFYGGAETGGAEDVFRLGTSLTRGRATAGVDLTAENGTSRRQISGVYLGLDLSEGISVGMSREVERDRDGVEQPARFGIGAAMDFGAGQVVSGAVSDVSGETPTFGLMLGLQF